jgi:hypothetical protein
MIATGRGATMIREVVVSFDPHLMNAVAKHRFQECAV